MDTSNYTPSPPISIWLGADVGKSFHHFCALNESGEKIMNDRVNQNESEIKDALTALSSKGEVLVVVDQINTIGSLLLNIAHSMGIKTAYLPGLQMRNAARLMGASSKTDPEDAYVIAYTSKNMPEVLRNAEKDSEEIHRLKILCGYDDDITRNSTEIINQIRSILLEISPAFERVFVGTRLTSKSALALLERYGTPRNFKKSGVARVKTFARKHKLRGSKIIDDIFKAVLNQTVEPKGISTYEMIVKSQIRRLKDLILERDSLQKDIEKMARELPECELLETIPGCGIQSAAKIVMAIGDIDRFSSAAELAAYAGAAPKISQSGTSIYSVRCSRGGNHTLKNALFQISFGALTNDAKMRKLYDQKTKVEGKKHAVAMTHLMKKRCKLIFAILKHKEPFEPLKYSLAESKPKLKTLKTVV